MNAALIARNTAAATALLAAGVGIGEADFWPVVQYDHVIADGRQLAHADPGVARLDSIDNLTGNTGRLEAQQSPGDPAWCWQVNGFQVPSSQTTRCNALSALAAAMVSAPRARDGLEYEAAAFRAFKLNDPTFAWHYEARLSIPMECVPR